MANRKVGRWIVLGAALALGVIMIAGNVNLYRVFVKSRSLQEQVEELKGSIDSLNREIEKLKSDTAYIERLARERLGMARKDEKVYKFVQEDE